MAIFKSFIEILHPFKVYNLMFREGNGNPLQCSCLENPADRGAWRAAVHRIAHDWSNLACMHACIGEGNGNPLQCSCLENLRAEEPGGLQSIGSRRVGHNWATSLFTFMPWRRQWQPTPVFLPGESQGRRSLVGCRLWGRTESDTTDATQQQQQRHIHNVVYSHYCVTITTIKC